MYNASYIVTVIEPLLKVMMNGSQNIKLYLENIPTLHHLLVIITILSLLTSMSTANNIIF